MTTTRTVLAGDIGGTKTLLQLAEHDGTRSHVLLERRFDCAAYDHFMPLLGQFLDECGPGLRLDGACFGVAGPIEAGRAKVTQLPWLLDAAELSQALGAPALLINDFAAVGYGIAELEPADLMTLQAAEAQPQGVRAVIGAGTGLGMATLHWDGRDYRVSASEGSHADFGPGSEEEIELLRHLAGRYGHVSWERVVSGPGIVAIYSFLCSQGHRAGAELSQALTDGDDHAAVLAGFALRAADPLAVRTLGLFVGLFGAAAGNLALTSLPRGGLYLAGGIGPKIAPLLAQGRFMERFRDKGRFEALLGMIPVALVTHPNLGLLGARRVALHQAV